MQTVSGTKSPHQSISISQKSNIHQSNIRDILTEPEEHQFEIRQPTTGNPSRPEIRQPNVAVRLTTEKTLDLVAKKLKLLPYVQQTEQQLMQPLSVEPKEAWIPPPAQRGPPSPFQSSHSKQYPNAAVPSTPPQITDLFVWKQLSLHAQRTQQLNINRQKEQQLMQQLSVEPKEPQTRPTAQLKLPSSPPPVSVHSVHSKHQAEQQQQQPHKRAIAKPKPRALSSPSSSSSQPHKPVVAKPKPRALSLPSPPSSHSLLPSKVEDVQPTRKRKVPERYGSIKTDNLTKPKYIFDVMDDDFALDSNSDHDGSELDLELETKLDPEDLELVRDSSKQRNKPRKVREPKSGKKEKKEAPREFKRLKKNHNEKKTTQK